MHLPYLVLDVAHNISKYGFYSHVEFYSYPHNTVSIYIYKISTSSLSKIISSACIVEVICFRDLFFFPIAKRNHFNTSRFQQHANIFFFIIVSTVRKTHRLLW
jgi:hypothetical protein